MKHVVNFLLGIPKTLFGGYVLSKLWLWFVVPVFGLPAFSCLRGVGLMSVIGFLQAGVVGAIVMANPPKEPQKDGEFLAIAVTALWLLVLYPLALGAGYLWHLAIVAWS